MGLLCLTVTLKLHQLQLHPPLSPHPQYFAYKATVQDWQKWVQLGLVEELICQIYRRSRQTFLAELQQSALQSARQRISVGIGILTGSLSHPVAIAQIQNQVQLVRDRGYSGVSFFTGKACGDI